MKSTRGPPLAHAPQQRQPIDLGQPDVADDDVDGARLQHGQTLRSVAGFVTWWPASSQRFGQGDPQVRFVVYEQDLQRHLRTLPERRMT